MRGVSETAPSMTGKDVKTKFKYFVKPRKALGGREVPEARFAIRGGDVADIKKDGCADSRPRLH